MIKYVAAAACGIAIVFVLQVESYYLTLAYAGLAGAFVALGYDLGRKK